MREPQRALPYLIAVTFAVALYCALIGTSQADVNYFPVRGEAICPSTHARGLLVNSTNTQCMQAGGNVASPLRTGTGKRVVINMLCPVQTTALTNSYLFYANDTGNAHTPICSYGATHLAGMSASIEVTDYSFDTSNNSDLISMLLLLAYALVGVYGWAKGFDHGKERLAGWEE